MGHSTGEVRYSSDVRCLPHHYPPRVIPLPITPLGAVQTMIAVLLFKPPPQVPTPHPTLVSNPEIAPVPLPAPPARARSRATPLGVQFAEPNSPVPSSVSSVSSHDPRIPTPPYGTPRVTRSYPTSPLAPNPSRRPIPAPGRDVNLRSPAPYGDNETAWETHEDRDTVRFLVTVYVTL